MTAAPPAQLIVQISGRCSLFRWREAPPTRPGPAWAGPPLPIGCVLGGWRHGLVNAPALAARRPAEIGPALQPAGQNQDLWRPRDRDNMAHLSRAGPRLSRCSELESAPEVGRALAPTLPSWARRARRQEANASPFGRLGRSRDGPLATSAVHEAKDHRPARLEPSVACLGETGQIVSVRIISTLERLLCESHFARRADRLMINCRASREAGPRVECGGQKADSGRRGRRRRRRRSGSGSGNRSRRRRGGSEPGRGRQAIDHWTSGQ